MDTLYFDNNATTPMDPAVAARMQELYSMGLANAASQHRSGRTALRVIERAKSDLLRLIDAPCDGMDSAQVILTSGGTEANNLAIAGLCRSVEDDAHDHESTNAVRVANSLVSGIEHPSVLEAAAEWSSRVRILPVDSSGLIRLDVLEDWLKTADANNDRIGLVSVMLGNNETGVISRFEDHLRPVSSLWSHCSQRLCKPPARFPFQCDSAVSTQ